MENLGPEAQAAVCNQATLAAGTARIDAFSNGCATPERECEIGVPPPPTPTPPAPPITIYTSSWAPSTATTDTTIGMMYRTKPKINPIKDRTAQNFTQAAPLCADKFCGFLGFEEADSCQCDFKCAARADCCDDYDEFCATTPTATSAPVGETVNATATVNGGSFFGDSSRVLVDTQVPSGFVERDAWLSADGVRLVDPVECMSLCKATDSVAAVGTDGDADANDDDADAAAAAAAAVTTGTSTCQSKRGKPSYRDSARGH